MRKGILADLGFAGGFMAITVWVIGTQFLTTNSPPNAAIRPVVTQANNPLISAVATNAAYTSATSDLETTIYIPADSESSALGYAGYTLSPFGDNGYRFEVIGHTDHVGTVFVEVDQTGIVTVLATTGKNEVQATLDPNDPYGGAVSINGVYVGNWMTLANDLYLVHMRNLDNFVVNDAFNMLKIVIDDNNVIAMWGNYEPGLSGLLGALLPAIIGGIIAVIAVIVTVVIYLDQRRDARTQTCIDRQRECKDADYDPDDPSCQYWVENCGGVLNEQLALAICQQIFEDCGPDPESYQPACDHDWWYWGCEVLLDP